MTISTLVDANVLLDITSDLAVPAHREWSQQALITAVDDGPLFVNAIVWSEVTQRYPSDDLLRRQLRFLRLYEIALPFAAAFLAGQAHRRYRERGGRRDRTLPDFLIGAHASVAGHRLLTRDGGRYRTYFPDLDIICQETHP